MLSSSGAPPSGLRGRATEAAPWDTRPRGILGIRQDPAAGSVVPGTLCRSKRTSRTAILTTSPPQVGPGDPGRQRAAGYCGFEIQTTSCPMKVQHQLPPAVCSRPPQPFCQLETIPQSEAIPSSEMWEKAAWWGQRVETPEPPKGSACPFGPLGNTRFRCPEEAGISSGQRLGTVP